MALPSRLVAVMVTASLGGWWLGVSRHDPVGTAEVVAVVDGDTVEVTVAGRREIVRLLGVDAPETVDPRRPVECFGPEASAFTRARLVGRTVGIEFDRVRRDAYQRLLAYLEVDGVRFNDVLLAGGYARLLVIPPNGAHGRELLSRELEARQARRGLWKVCER